jgi:hypothetical protein
MPKGMLMLTLILIAGFKTCNGTKPNSLTKSSTTMNKPATSNTELSSHEGTRHRSMANWRATANCHSGQRDRDARAERTAVVRYR